MGQDHEVRVPDRRLVTLVGLAAVLSLGHTADHVARGDLPWPPTAASLPFILTTLALYGGVGWGLSLYVQHKVGPRFWALVAGLGVVVGWLAHFSPWTEQPPRSIVAAYPSAAAGWLALGCLVALMLVLLLTATYAGALWMRKGP
jgi:hypothetical protein